MVANEKKMSTEIKPKIKCEFQAHNVYGIIYCMPSASINVQCPYLLNQTIKAKLYSAIYGHTKGEEYEFKLCGLEKIIEK